MKKWITMLLAFSMLFSGAPAAAADAQADAAPIRAAAAPMRAAWMATVYNIDFPTAKGDAEAQKAEFNAKLDALQKAGFNAVIVQVRPKADALYKSNINPWSDVLTGTQGKDPGYDPLAFMIEAAHSRGMELHAWLNPYRVTTSGTDLTALADRHPAKRHPDWVLAYNNAMFYDPSKEEVKEHICDTVAEIVRNYDVDGIHFDDYFYPSNYPLPDGETREGEEANARREHVNDMMKRVYDTIKGIDASVQFGVSPVGIWKNRDSDPQGSDTKGSEGYYELFADARAWIDGGYVDYVAPQLYWEMGRTDANYEKLVEWWAWAVRNSNVKLYIGQGIYKDAVAAEIDKQLTVNTKYGVSGSFFYSTRDIIDNRQGVADTLAKTASETAPSGQTQTPPAAADDGVTFLSDKPETALPSSPAVVADGTEVTVEAYNLGGYTYFKLRDIAAVLNGSAKQFSVGWNAESRRIAVKTGEAYESTGGEMTAGAKQQKNALLCKITLVVDGSEVYLTAYNIDGNNYIKLRELAAVLDFGVTWNESPAAIGIVSTTGYTE